MIYYCLVCDQPKDADYDVPIELDNGEFACQECVDTAERMVNSFNGEEEIEL